MSQSSQELREALLAEEEEFAAAAAHDLKAPLRDMANVLSWLEADLGPKASPEQLGYLETLKERVARMNSLLAGLLEFCRAGQAGPPPQEADLNELLSGLSAALDPRPGLRIEVEAKIPGARLSLPPLRQLLFHLASNAVRHHDKPEGLVRLEAKDLGDSVEFSVSDDGPGIPLKDQQRVFKLGQSLKSKDEGGGPGIGLAVARRIATCHQARLTLESEPGKGSRFSVAWPKTP